MLSKYIFLIASTVLSILMLVVVFLCLTKNDRNSKYLAFTVFAGLISVLTYDIHILMENEIAAYFSAGFFYSSIDLLLFAIGLYIFYFTGEDFTIAKEKVKIYCIAYWAICSIDIFLLLTNAIPSQHHSFLLKKYFVPADNGKEVFYCWIRQDFLFYKIHLLISYIQVLLIFALLLKRISKSQKFYRKKFTYILSTLAAVIVTDAFFVYLGNFVHLNYSTLAYGLLTVIFYYITFYVVRNEIINNVIKFVSHNIDNGIACFDIENNCIYLNEKAQLIFQSKNSALKNAENYCHDKLVFYSATKKEKFCWEDKFKINETLEGSNDLILHEYDYKVDYRLLKDNQDKILGSYICLEDQTELHKNYRVQNFKATHDSLTGLYTRAAFLKKAMQIIKENPMVERYLIATNIKKFKIINDFFGNETGDIILKKQAELLLQLGYKDSIAGRISNDRYALLINKADYNISDYLMISDEIQRILDAKNCKIDFEIGIYSVEAGDTNIQSMYDKAVLAIEHIKNSYISGPQFYDKKLMEDLLYEKNIIRDFERGIKNEDFCLFLHPQFDEEKNLIGAEALVRWRHPLQGLLQPGDFIPILEKTGCISALDKFIWEKACALLQKWKRMGMEKYYISINISNNDFYYKDVYETLISLVKKYEIAPSQLNLEITENVVMNDSPETVKVISDLRDFGFKIEMDDFGTGLASLNVLKNVKMDVLKIDMGFLADKENISAEQKNKIETKRKIILSAIIKMAKSLDMSVVTEGVETEEQFQFLKEKGSNVFQGYYLSKPICVGDFENLFFWK